MLRWSSRASPIPRVGSSSRRRVRKRALVELGGEDVRPERREPQVEARAALGHQLEHRPVELDHLVLGRADARATRGAASATSACRARTRPTCRPSAGASGASGRRRSAGRGACRARPRDARRARRAAPASGPSRDAAAGSRSRRSPCRRGRRRPGARRRGSCLPQALSVSFRGPCRKPSSTSRSSTGEPTIGSPSKRSSASRLSRPAPHVLGERLERLAQPRLVRLAERDEPLAAALDVEHRLGVEQHDVRARHARRPAAAGPRRAAATAARRRRDWPGSVAASTSAPAGSSERSPRSRSTAPRERELRAAEALDEVAAPGGAERLEVRQLAVERREAARARPRPGPSRG